jgi:hypothetical protein
VKLEKVSFCTNMRGWTDFPRRKHTIHELVRQAVSMVIRDKLGRFSGSNDEIPLSYTKNLPNLFHDPREIKPIFILSSLSIVYIAEVLLSHEEEQGSFT